MSTPPFPGGTDASRLSGKIVRAKGAREQVRHGGFHACITIANRDNPHGGTKFRDHLPAGPAGSRRLFCGRVNDDAAQRARSLRDRGENRGPLGAIAESVGRVFHVRARNDFSVLREHGGADRKSAVGRVGMLRRITRGFFQSTQLHGSRIHREHQSASSAPSSARSLRLASMPPGAEKPVMRPSAPTKR